MRDLLVIDLECTCHPRREAPPDFFSEIIEIGAVLLDADTRQPRWEFDRMVRPHVDARLTPFCTELTTITQAEVDAGVPLAQALQELMAEVGEAAYLFASWGFYDRRQFESNCARYGIPYPFGDHISLKHEFAVHFRRPPVGMAGALKTLQMPLLGTHHRGIDDARNIAAITARMLEAGWEPRFVQPGDRSWRTQK